MLHNKKLMSMITGFDAFNSSMTGATCEAGTANHYGVPEFTPDVGFVLLDPSFFFWPLYCMSFIDLRLLIGPLASSNFSYAITS